jgi:hypothetical protein
MLFLHYEKPFRIRRKKASGKTAEIGTILQVPLPPPTTLVASALCTSLGFLFAFKDMSLDDGETHAKMRFETFSNLIMSLESALLSGGNEDKLYSRSHLFDVARFKRDFLLC